MLILFQLFAWFFFSYPLLKILPNMGVLNVNEDGLVGEVQQKDPSSDPEHP